VSAEVLSSNPGFAPAEVGWLQKKDGKTAAYNLGTAQCGATGGPPHSPANFWAGIRRSGYSYNVGSL